MGVQATYNEKMGVGLEGQLYDTADTDIVPMTNKEASASVRIGQAVCFEGSTDDLGALSPDATTDKLVGIVAHSHAYSNSPNGDMDATGALKPGAVLNVVREGRILVKCANGCVPGDRLFVRVLAGLEGELRSAADGVNTIDATTQGQWLSTATAGNLAWLDVDFSNK